MLRPVRFLRTRTPRYVTGKPTENLRSELPRKPRDAGADRLFQGRGVLVLRNGQGDSQAPPAVQESRHQARRQDSAHRPQQPPLVHHLHRHYHLRSGHRTHSARLHAQRHHPHHQPLGEPPAFLERQLLGRHRRRTDPPDRSGLLADGLQGDLRTRRQVADEIPARHRQEPNTRGASTSTTSNTRKSPTTG